MSIVDVPVSSVTVNLIVSALPVTQPVMAPSVSVPPAAGRVTSVTPPTGLVPPAANVTLGAEAAACV